MLTIGGFLAKLMGTEGHRESPIATERVSDKTHQDPAERERQHWEAMQHGIDELVAQLSQESRLR